MLLERNSEMDTSDWSTQAIAEYLETIGLGSYQSIFIENDISGEGNPYTKLCLGENTSLFIAKEMKKSNKISIKNIIIIISILENTKEKNL